ncbi:MAG: HAD family phosphatase [Lachnoclostridium sp.]|nr:HAD family phosphatase [Lachnoclostridium sp.]
MIKNLLFDLGGVIMDIDRMNCVRAFEKLGFSDIADYLGDYGQKEFFLALEAGELGPEEFRAKVREHLPAGVSDEQIDLAFNAFLTGIPVHRLRQLEALRKEYPVYLLSNTNPIMMSQDIAKEFRKDGHDINHYFDGIVTSYEAKCCKPGRKIFDYTAEKFDIKPEETLFFDDSQSNVDAARSYGYQAVKVNPGDEFADLLNSMK